MTGAKFIIWHGSVVVVTEEGNSKINHFGVGVEAETHAEAVGKLHLASNRLFPGKRIDVQVNDLKAPVIVDPNNAALFTNDGGGYRVG